MACNSGFYWQICKPLTEYHISNMKFFTRSLLISVLLSGFFVSNAQNNMGVGTLNPDVTAILDLTSNTKGFLPPRMSQVDRDAIVNPADGLIVYNTTDSVLDYFNGSCWLPVYLEDCNGCYFTLSASNVAGTIDRLISNSVSTAITISQSNGSPQNIAFTVVGNLPPGITYTITPNPQFSSGVISVVFYASPFAPAGTFPIVIQAMCGTTTQNLIYALTVDPCYYVAVSNSETNYDVSANVFIQNPNAPQNQPICVAVEVMNGVSITSDTNITAAFTTGNLFPGSLVSVVNNGTIIGRGGNGGISYDPTTNPPTTGVGDNGGNAINLTIDAQIQNNGLIFGGGGGGNAMAFDLSYTLPPPANFITFGIFIGAGGGGGAGVSYGGNSPNGVIGLSVYNPGQGGTGGQLGLGGPGGYLNYPIPINAGPATITLTPIADAGDGGNYGYPGGQGNFNLYLSAYINVNIPFVGNVQIPVVTNLALPIPIPYAIPASAGYAIKRNGFNTSIPDNLYQTSFIKGQVGN